MDLSVNPHETVKTVSVFLAKAKQMGKTGKKRGRPVHINPQKDRRIFEVWDSGEHKTYEDWAIALDKTGVLTKYVVRRAPDRHQRHLDRRK